MKYYTIHFFNTNTQSIEDYQRLATVKAKNHIEALKKYYTTINNMGGSFKNFIYTAIETNENLYFTNIKINNQ